MPQVSVVIPTYNRCALLQEAVASCFDDNGALDVEVVVVDDGSTDGTREWLQRHADDRVRPILREHEGAQQARNAGLEAAEGDAIKFLDSDDYLYPSILREQYEMLVETGADVCYGPIDIVDGDGEVYGHKPNPLVEDLLGGVATGTVTTYPHVFLYRDEAARWEQWRPEVPFHQDTAYALDIAVHDPSLVQADTTVGVHRAHEGTRVTTTTKSESAVENIRYKAELLYRAFSRRKVESGVPESVRRDIAFGLWRQAHKLAPADFSFFQRWWQRIQKIHSRFQPPRPNLLLRGLDQIMGPRMVEQITNPLRIIKAKLGTKRR